LESLTPRPGIREQNLQKDDGSILHLYQELIRLRKETPAFHSGDYAPLRSRNDLLLYERFTVGERFIVALNLTMKYAASILLTAETSRCRHILIGRIWLSSARFC
jgi:glycosidase